MRRDMIRQIGWSSHLLTESGVDSVASPINRKCEREREVRTPKSNYNISCRRVMGTTWHINLQKSKPLQVLVNFITIITSFSTAQTFHDLTCAFTSMIFFSFYFASYILTISKCLHFFINTMLRLNSMTCHEIKTASCSETHCTQRPLHIIKPHFK